MYGIKITTYNGTIEWKRHIDQIIDRKNAEWQSESSTDTEQSTIPAVMEVPQRDSTNQTPASSDGAQTSHQNTAFDASSYAVDTSPELVLPAHTLPRPERQEIDRQPSTSSSSVTSSTSPKTLTVTSRGRVVMQPRRLHDFITNR